MAELEGIEVGVRVWIVTSGRKRIQKVLRVTPKQIKLDNNATYSKGGGSIPRGYGFIDRVATPEECKQWDAEVEEKRKAAAQRAQESDRLNALRDELSQLFEDEYSVYEAMEDGKWTVELTLTEEGVRHLAELLKGERNGIPRTSTTGR